MNKKIYEYEALIRVPDDGIGAYVIFPYNIKEEFGKGIVPVNVTFDSEPYQGNIVNMGLKNPDGSVCYIIGLTKAIRTKIGKQAGDIIKVTIQERQISR